MGTGECSVYADVNFMNILTDVKRIRGNVMERKERYGQTVLLGVRFKL